MTYQPVEKISKHVFRAYDIRSIVDDNFSENHIYTIALAIGSEMQAQAEKGLYVARDARLSSPSLSKALIQGLVDSGCDVIDLGIVPTPLLYFATYTLEYRSGVMLTASHNPANYNGIKMVINRKTLAKSQITALYQRISQQDFHFAAGSVSNYDIKADYIARIKSDVQTDKPLRIGIDCGNGVTGLIASELFKAIGCEVSELYCDLDGNFPNHHPDPSEEKNLQDLKSLVINDSLDIGIAFDGDGDRLGVVTNKGNMIYPDRQLMLYARELLPDNPNATIIFDVKCSRHLAEIIKKYKGNPVMSKTGHSLVKAAMRDTNALLAGEMSGHIFFKERWYGFDDALYAASRLLEIISHYDKTTDELFAELPDSINTPEIKIVMSDEKKFDFVERFQRQSTFPEAELITVDGLRVEFSDGWGLIRVSNTTPAVVLRFEADNEEALQRIQNIFKQNIRAVDNSLVIPF